MWETVKNDPILKTLAVIMLGVISFGLAFNVMFGAGTTGGMDSGMGAGYSITASLSGLWLFLIKLMFVAVVIALLIIIAKAVKTNLFEGSEIKMQENFKNDPILKTLVTIILAVIALGITVHVFNGILGGGSYAGGMRNNGGYYGYGMYAASGFSLTGVLVFLIKLLLSISIIGLIVGIGAYLLQNNNLSLKSFNFFNTTTAGNTQTAVVKEFCKNCGAEMKEQWKCCPLCGQERSETASAVIVTPADEATVTVKDAPITDNDKSAE